MRNADIRQILLDAHSILLNNGWIQHASHNEHGHCLSGAIARASIGPLYHRALGLVLRKIHDSENTATVAEWNDMPERTMEQVLNMLQIAIESCSQESAENQQ